jgi:hypothetical protein
MGKQREHDDDNPLNWPIVDHIVVDGRIINIRCQSGLEGYPAAKQAYWDSLQPKNRKVKRPLVEEEKPNVAVA